MKILHIISHYKLGGAEICTFELKNHMPKNTEIAIQAVIGQFEGSYFDSGINGCNINCYDGASLPLKFGGLFQFIFRLRKTLDTYNPNIIHLNTEIPEFSFFVFKFIFRQYKNIKVVRTIHNTELWGRWQLFGMHIERALVCSPCIFVSNEVKSQYQLWLKRCNLNVAEGSVIYNPIAIYTSQARKRPASNENFKLLFAGRLEKQKGADLLPEIIERLENSLESSVSLDILGDGSELENINSYLRSQTLSKISVNVLPPKFNLPSTLSNYDLLLFPSRFEGYGRLAAEAVLADLPVAAFYLRVLKEIFGDHYSGFCMSDLYLANDFSQTVINSLKNIEALRDELDMIRDRLEVKLSPKSVTEQYQFFYQSLLNEKA
jgi:glycosyltransferase involved in cell wall biosynthesis